MEHLHAFVKVSAVFVAVVVAMKKKVPMGVALSGGGIAIALLMGHSPSWIARRLAGRMDAILFSADTVGFVAVLGLIIALSSVLEASGRITALTESFRGALRSPRLTVAVLPSVIGLLPMPGGALFSAPMVEAAAAGTRMDAEDKALVNYWYRHVWEYAWPLYPGVIYTAQLMSLNVGQIALVQLPLILAALAAGLLLLMRAGPAPQEHPPGRLAAAGRSMVLLLPFLVIFALALVAQLDIVLSVAVGTATACAWQLAARNLGFGRLLKTVFANPHVLAMMTMGYGAKIFGGLMNDSGAIEGISRLFQSMHLPPVLLAALLPFVVGFFSGMTIVHVMTTFPILLAYPGIGTGAQAVPVMVFAYAAGYVGVLLSPVHACLVLSTIYFKGDLLKELRRMLLPCALLVAAGAGLLLLYRVWSPL